MQIMILDDSPDFVDLLTAMLQTVIGKENCQIVTGHNGHDGLALLDQITPDVIFTNLRMPLMDGITFAHELRRHKAYDQVHLVMVSALSTSEIMIEAQDSGVDSFLPIPFSLRDIKATLSTVLDL